MVTKYVLPNASLPEVINEPVDLTLTYAQKQAVLALGDITVLTVRKVIKTNKAHAQAVIDKYHAEGKIKTYSERYAELYPSEEII